MDKVSCGDMRQALSFFRTFLLSENTDVAEMLEIEQAANLRNDHYEIPFHHVIKSIILQNSRVYSMDNSPIMNLFEFDPMKSDSHFLNIRVLRCTCITDLVNTPFMGEASLTLMG